jgi:hypothetical protein
LSATGTRWSGRASSVSSNSKRRRGSIASTGRFTPQHSDLSDSDEGFDDDDPHLGDGASVVSHPEVFALHREDGRPPLAYSSLPATPISSSPRPHTPPPRLPSASFHAAHDPLPQQTCELEHSPDDSAPFSIWEYLREELLATDFDSHQELKWERVSNFLSMPVAIEKVGLVAIQTSLLLRCSARIDHDFRIHCLPRLVPLYLHYPPHTICTCIQAVAGEHLQPLRPSIAAVPEG